MSLGHRRGAPISSGVGICHRTFSLSFISLSHSPMRLSADLLRWDSIGTGDGDSGETTEKKMQASDAETLAEVVLCVQTGK
ncbi:hypothetical protein LWI28_022576 [Acer negundo]|uniref:Uncharacterized protein n=1 Tax=Acer negundo TaxID=4023 RepID=A0AAD5JHC4_ACENE|nr:hypothetical protein LWI28_022576 [Acer negundo]